MKLIIGLACVLCGGAAMLYGIGTGVWPIIALYRDTLADPMNQAGNQAESQAITANMWRAVTVGFLGAIPFLIGTVLLKMSLFQKVRRTMRGGR
jgi:hypothetical protein